MTQLKSKLPGFILVLLLCSCFIAPFVGKASEFSGSKESSLPEGGLVLAVYDGDTIKVRFKNGLEKKVRFIGVNAPEISSPQEEVKFRAYMSKRFSFYYLFRKHIKLTYDWEAEDKYGRLLAYVWTEREGLFNKFILAEGFASVFLKFPFRKDYRRDFVEAEQTARSLKKGLWREGSYPTILACDTKNYLGKLISVQFICTEPIAKGKFIFIRPSGREFSALIPREKISLFSKLRPFKGKDLSVTGFLEEYRGRPQIVLFFPDQIEIRKQ